MISLSGADLDLADLDYALHMRRALSLAQTVLTTTPNPRVGCVIVGADDEVLGEGWHAAPGQAHAEIMALQHAGERARLATVFVSLEPCAHHGRTPPCTDALIAAGVKTVVIAVQDPFPAVAGNGIRKLEGAGIQVIHLPEFEAAARAINAGFFKRQERGLPYVRCKLAMSLDGRTAAADGSSQWITGTEARGQVQRLRAASCAVLTGIGTVLADDPALTVRPAALDLSDQERRHNAFALQRQPLRVILDSRLRTPARSRILQEPGQVLICSGSEGPGRYGDNVTVQAQVHWREGVAPRAVLESLAAEHGVNEVLVEAGPALSGSFLQAGLVDELIIYLAPKLLGHQGLPLMILQNIATLQDSLALEILDIARLGPDCRIIARPGKPAGDNGKP
ncbi:MAG: hypothetical protein RLZZ385_786 [Pseudomonadota bacterium]